MNVYIATFEQFKAAASQLQVDLTLEINITGDRQAAILFGSRIQATRACRYLGKFGINPDAIARTCMLFWMLKPIDPATVRGGANGRPYKRQIGRPQNTFSLFQLVCDRGVSDRPHGRRFYREFCELAAMVFNHKPVTFRATREEIASYRSRLKRVRRLARLRFQGRPTRPPDAHESHDRNSALAAYHTAHTRLANGRDVAEVNGARRTAKGRTIIGRESSLPPPQRKRS